MSCGVGCRHSTDLVLLWLWRSLAAIALIRPLARELPCAAGGALKKKKFEQLGTLPCASPLLDCTLNTTTYKLKIRPPEHNCLWVTDY